MATTSNPFEPPRSDLDGSAGAAPGALVLSEEALRALVATTPWVRALARLTAASIAVGFVAAVADLVATTSFRAKTLAMLVLAVGTAVSTALLVVLRRYAYASERLRAGTRSAAGQIVDAQASWLRLMAVLLLLAAVLTLGLLLITAVGFARSGGLA
jgi:hypothetical protein